MNMLQKNILITCTAGAMVLGIDLSSGNAWAGETAGQKIDRVAHKAGNGIRKGAEWVGNGIKKGAAKAGEGISKGMSHAAKGVRKGAEKTGEALTTVGNKLQQSST